MARRNLLDFTKFTHGDYRPAPHHERICEALEAVARGECKRLMVFMPPRHGKSELASRRFPAWYLGAFPRHQIIAASYNSELASDFGREVRNIVGSREYRALFETQLAPDSQAANRWHTSSGGSDVAAGVGTAITGRGAHVLLIDDPLKDREEADSTTTRNRVWDWYTSTAYTRLMPGGAIVLIQCLTGDTLVTMANGGRMPLRDVRPGHMVLSYLNGGTTSARVLNWASNGVDCVYEIRTMSGASVKGNERHPFLIDRDGKEEWVRIRDLKVGDKIKTAQAIGVSGGASSVDMKTVTSQQKPKAIACPITTRSDGQAGIALHQSMPAQDAQRISDTVTASIWSSMNDSCISRAGDVLYAMNCRETTSERIGEGSFALTMTTIPAEFAASCVTIATSPLATESTPNAYAVPPNTFRIGNDQIVSIQCCGTEEVFDIQVEGTENFIANGMVSHNTRWHEDDLAGRLLTAQARTGGDKWDVLELKAIDEQGDALWPEWYPVPELERIRSVIGPRDWSALYQQSPIPDGKSEFRRDWLRWYQNSLSGEGMNVYILVDPAGEKKKTSDRTAMWVVGLNNDGNYYLLDFLYDRLNLTERARELMRLHRKWRPMRVGYEKYGKDSDIEAVKIVQAHENYRFDIVPLGGSLKKEDRIRRLVPLFEAGKVYAPPTMHRTLSDGRTIDILEQFLVEEYDRFPVGAHDDGMDCLARITDPDMNATFPLLDAEPERYSKRRTNGSAWAA